MNIKTLAQLLAISGVGVCLGAVPGLADGAAPSTWHLQIVGKRDGLSDARRYA
jgi:hypothetical protein